MRTRWYLAALAALGVGAASAQAAELSLVSGVLRTEDSEVAKNDAGGKKEISAGGRFSEQLDAHMFWFAQGILDLRSYDKGDAAEGPSDSTSLSLGGGVRYYFTKLAENVSPFVYGLGQYKSDKDAVQEGTSYTETEENGLYYGAAFGIRLGLDKDFFVDLESKLFESALFATEKSETTDFSSGTPVPGGERETKRTELYASSSGPLDITVALGMRL